MSDLWEYVALMLSGLVVTLQLTLAASILMIVLAVAAAVGSIAPARAPRWIARGYIDVVRSIPVLVALIIMYFVVGPIVDDFGVNPFVLAAVGLGIVESAYLADVLRGALQAIPHTQWEAGYSLGMGWWSTLVRAIAPQAVRAAIPSTANMIIFVIKDSALASVITVNEVTLVAHTLVARTFQPMEIYLTLAVMYLVVIVPLMVITGGLERRAIGRGARVIERAP